MTSLALRVGSALLVIAGLALPVLAPGGQPVASAAAAQPARGSLTAATQAGAHALAVSSGQPVQVTADETDWSQTFAEPAGGFQTSVSAEPQRVQLADGSWTPVDTTLSVQADGLVAPGAITTGLTLSDGGTGPLYTLTAGSKSLAVSWPLGSLPVPSLSGPTATYSGVLPGVNLLVSATPTGVSELIEVTSATAAANPALAAIRFPVTMSGLSLAADGQGDLTASDASGDAVFSAPVPQMWDSAGSAAGGGPAGPVVPQAGTAAGAGGPVPGDHVASLGVAASAAAVTLTPAASVLTGNSVVYPVFIDPSFSRDSSQGTTWSDVGRDGTASTGWGDWEPTGSPGGIRSGVSCNEWYTDTGACVPGTTYTTYRSFLNFPVPSSMWGASYVDASLSLNQSWSWGCSPPNGPTSFALYDTENGSNNNVATTSSTSWPGPATGNKDASSPQEQDGGGTACPANVITLTAQTTAQQAAQHDWSVMTLRLSATSGDENNLNQWSWKRFDVDSMVLYYFWQNAPAKPTGYGTQGAFNPANGQTDTGCSTSESSPDWVNTSQPVWQASIDYADGDTEPMDADFAWTNLSSGNNNTLVVGGNSGLAPGLFEGSRTGSQGDEYSWQVSGVTAPDDQDPLTGNDISPQLQGPSAPTCYFAINTNANAPTTAPAVTSSDYQPDEPVGTQNSFTFTAGNATTAPAWPTPGNDIVGFYYGINNSQPSIYVPASTIGSTSSSATITFAPFTTQQLTLYVKAVDMAGNLSPVSAPFTIDTTATDNIATLGWWKLNDGTKSAGSGSPAADLTLSGSGASYSCTPPSFLTGYTGCLNISGTAEATGGAVVGNDASFSVSAWVNPAASGQDCSPCVIMSQDATNVSAFSLAYQPTGTAGSQSVHCPCWVFSMPQQDETGSAVDTAAVAAVNAAGSWTQLTGVFNATQQQLLLYVDGGDVGAPGGQAGDGNPAATTAALPWSSPGTGAFHLGLIQYPDGGGETSFAGSMSDACAFYGVLQQTDVEHLYDNGSGDGCSVLNADYP